MKLRFRPGQLKGAVQAPPSKSAAHRMMILAALSEGESRIAGILESEDVCATVDCIRALGAECDLSGGTLLVSGVGGKQNTSEEPIFCCRESGSTLRFMIPVALSRFRKCRFTGTPRLLERGIGIYEELLKNRGFSIVQGLSEDGTAYVDIEGVLSPGSFSVNGNVSSQFITGLLFALPLLSGDSTLKILPPVESRPYIDLTLGMLHAFGVDCRETGPDSFRIPGRQRPVPGRFSVEGDWSNGAALLSFSALGNEIRVTGLSENSLQGDKRAPEFLKQLDLVPEGAVESGNAKPVDLRMCPDLAPVLMAVSAAKRGGVFTGTARLKIKESDRAEAMKAELGKFGIRVTVEDDRVIVHPGILSAPSETLSSHNDHRIVMALMLLLSLTGGEIDGAEAVNKSYPGFFNDLQALGADFSAV